MASSESYGKSRFKLLNKEETNQSLQLILRASGADHIDNPF